MGPRLAGIPIADLSLLHAELALAGRPGMMLTPPPMVWSSPEMLAELSLLENDPPQQDPGYQTYKDGYNLILQEKWEDARKKLGELATKFSKSRYVDDAHYWVAYSWMKDQPKKAAQLYREFFKKYPTSNYFDDAVADLGRLEGNAAADSARASRSAYEARSFSQSMISAAPVIMPVPAIAPSPGQTYTVAPSTLFPPNAEGNADDPELRIKKNAIEALRRNPDERAFITISEIATDSKQHRELRKSALYALENFDRAKVLAIYLKIAQNDDDERIRRDALYYVGKFAKKNDAQALNALKQYAVDSKQPKEVRESAMHALKETDSGDALNLYLQIAKNDNDKNIKKSALYYIGQLAKGNDERAQAVLKEYALDRTQEREVRETALYSLKEIRGTNPLSIYLEIIKNDTDDRLRRSALYYIGQMARSNDDKAYQVLREYATDQKQEVELRETALHSLSELGRPDVLTILMEIAKNDPVEKIRSTAIYQIGEMRKHGSDVSKFLMDIARDQKQNKNIRKSAFYALRNFTNIDVYKFYADLAKNDPDKEIQQSAIYHIGHNNKNKAGSMELLMQLFDQLPADRTHAQESCLYGIADIGGDKAVDFLIKVAKTHQDYKIREKAVYYLGNIGGDKARSALLEILQGK